jgi:uncharacterized protein (DUF169 family)
MESQLADALNLKYPPVAVLWSNDMPADALQFVPGRWGCVMASFGVTAERGRPAVFDQETYGCWGGGVGLGFGNCYEQFPGGVDCFCRFLSTGNDISEKGRAVAEQCGGWMRGSLLEAFTHGERYRNAPATVDQWLKVLPMMNIPTKYVVFKRLDRVGAGERPVVIVYLANADQMSALVVMANYTHGGSENAIIPHAAGCQTIGIFAYREAESGNPRAVVGLNDLSARKVLRRLGKDLVTVALPFTLFQEMERNVAGSFLEREPWRSLRESNA